MGRRKKPLTLARHSVTIRWFFLRSHRSIPTILKRHWESPPWDRFYIIEPIVINTMRSRFENVLATFFFQQIYFDEVRCSLTTKYKLFTGIGHRILWSSLGSTSSRKQQPINADNERCVLLHPTIEVMSTIFWNRQNFQHSNRNIPDFIEYRNCDGSNQSDKFLQAKAPDSNFLAIRLSSNGLACEQFRDQTSYFDFFESVACLYWNFWMKSRRKFWWFFWIDLKDWTGDLCECSLLRKLLPFLRRQHSV